MSNAPCSSCFSCAASSCCACSFPPIPLCARCLPKHLQSSQLFHYSLPLSASTSIGRDNFDYWQDWLYALNRAQGAMKDNEELFLVLKEKAELAVEEIQLGRAGRLDELREFVTGVYEQVKRLVSAAIAETTELSTSKDPQFESPLSELIWCSAHSNKAVNLKLFDTLLAQILTSPRSQPKLIPKISRKSDDSRVTAAEERVKEYEREMMSLHSQLQDCEQSLLAKQSEIEKLNNLLMVKSRKLESYTQKNRALGTQTKRAKSRLQKILERTGLAEQLSVDDLLGIVEDYKPLDPAPEPTLQPPFPAPADSPRLPKSNFFHYYKERQPAIKATHPGISSNEVSAIIGKEWGRMSEDMKDRYTDLHRRDKERFRDEIRAQN